MTDRLFFVFDRTDRTHASYSPVAVAFDEQAARDEVERLRAGLPAQSQDLVFYRPASQTSIQVLPPRS